MSRFYVPKEFVKSGKITVSGKEAHHMLDVMRLKLSDEVVVFDGQGAEYEGVISQLSGKSVIIDIIKTRKSAEDKSAKVTLIQAIPKKEKMDFIIEKATELGAWSIIPTCTERVIPDWDDSKKSRQLERWKIISQEAAKQCARSDIPSVSPVSDFCEAIDRVKDHDLKLIAVLADDTISLKDALKGRAPCKIAVAIGPEGDFTPDEVIAARKASFVPVTLGSRVLKSDTAGLAVLAILNYETSNSGK